MSTQASKAKPSVTTETGATQRNAVSIGDKDTDVQRPFHTQTQFRAFRSQDVRFHKPTSKVSVEGKA